jgi:hypothetical protein
MVLDGGTVPWLSKCHRLTFYPGGEDDGVDGANIRLSRHRDLGLSYSLSYSVAQASRLQQSRGLRDDSQEIFPGIRF